MGTWEDGGYRARRMYRFLYRPKWLAFHLLVLTAVVVMVNLAFWQLRRLDERQQFNDEVRSREEVATQPVEALVPAGSEVDPESLEWYTVTATGTYLPDAQVLVINVSQGGAAGVDAVTPLQLADGRVLLVNRGFVAGQATVPPPPAGEVTVTGRVRASQKRRTGQLSDPADGVLTEIRRVDIDRLQQQIDAPVLPVYIDDLSTASTEIVPVAAPELTNGPHLSYTVQWFIFSAAAIVGWVLAVRHSARTRAAAAEAAAQASGEVHDPPAPASV